MVRSRPLRLAANVVVVLSAATLATCSDESASDTESVLVDTTTSATVRVVSAPAEPRHRSRSRRRR